MKKTVHKTKNVGTSFDHLKQSIPTGEEIEESSEKWVDMNIICTDTLGRQVRTFCELSYIAGYKQALKDLGHLNTEDK